MIISHSLRNEEATPIECLINPEPITVKGIKTFHPTFFYIYSGKKGRTPQFIAVEEKRDGSAPGAIFKKATQIEMDKKWMGKVGSPNGLLRNDPNSIRTRTKIEMNLDTIKEKLAYDLFEELGRGLFLVPKTRLSLQPIGDPYSLKHLLAVHWEESGIKDSLRIMSSFLPGYRDFAKADTLDGNEKISFMKYLEKYHRPPESILTSEGETVPLEGVIKLLAVGRCLADVDLLGGGGRNAGFVWIRNDAKKIIGARAVKIDPGFAFCFTHHSKDPSMNFVMNTAKKLGSVHYHLQDLKDLQTSPGNYGAIVHWNCLTQKQQDEFISVLLNTSRYLQSQEVLDLLFYREGKFSYPDPNHSTVAYLPKEIAEQMCQEMKTWTEWQLEIYAKPLNQFKNSYPEQLLRMHYLDRYGELSLPMKKETFPIRELFTELIIVDSKDKDDRKTTKILQDMLPKVDSFKETTHRLNLAPQTISLDKLFEHHRRILLIGRAGIGKSTLCQKIAHDWASGKLWKNIFEAIFWIPLRELNGIPFEDSAHFLLGVVMPRLFKHLPNPKRLCEPSKKILLILDGYDETTEELARQVENLLETAPFHILVTSRPGKVESLKVDQVVENIGFSDIHIKTYIDKFSKRHEKEVIHEVKGKELFSIIKESPHLYPMAHIPLQLQMIVSLYEKTGSVQQASSLTKLYQVMTSELYDWTLRGQKKEEKEHHLLQLGKIAAIGLQQGKLIIPHKKVQYLITDSLLETGILKKIEGEQPAYCFVHLTFQEYLTALYIQSKPLKKQEEFILEHRHKSSYQLVLAFLAGLIYSQSSEIETLFDSKGISKKAIEKDKPKIQINWFFDILYQKSNIMTLSHSYLLELTLRCLNECEGFKDPLLAIENLVKENPQIWDTLLSDGYSPLLSAANQRQNQALYWLADHYPFLLEKTGKWSKSKQLDITLFWLCAEKGNLGVLECLYQKNSKLISFANYDRTPLHAAASRGYVEVMKFLLEKDPLLISKFQNDGRTPLDAAAQRGHVEGMKFLLEKDPLLISKFGNDGWTPLHSAAIGGHVEAMKFLLGKNPLLISKFKNNGSTPFHSATYRGHVEAMQFLFEKDPKLLLKLTNNGTTPLHWAAQEGHVEAMKFLFEKDPLLISKFRNDGLTPFHSAVSGGHIEAMKFLFEKDPKLLLKLTNDGSTPFHWAASGGHVDAMKFLIEKDPLLISKFKTAGETPLHSAASGGHIEAMKFLLEKDPYLISKFTKYEDITPLHSAASEGHVEAMKFLLEKDPLLISKFKNDGATPLHSAVSGGHVEAMKFLLEKDPLLISKFKNDGATPLHWVAFRGHVEAMKFLIEKDPFLISKFMNVMNDGSTPLPYPLHWVAQEDHVEAMKFSPLHSAAYGGHVEAMKFLVEKNALLILKLLDDDYTPLHSAAYGGHVEAMKFLLEKDSSLISKFRYDGSTPLHFAASEGYVKAMKFLLEKDPKLISKFTNDVLTPLHAAAGGGHIEVMQFLLETDSELISKFSNDGLTPLHSAAFGGHIEAMKFLLEKDSFLISKFMNDGSTPLHLAAEGGSVEAMKFLLEKDPFLISKFGNDGKTPLHWAAQQGHVKAMKFLLEKDPFLISKFGNDGKTPLHEAAEGGHVEAMKFLLEKEPLLISKFTHYRATPLHLAAKEGYVDIGKWLYQQEPTLLNLVDDMGQTALATAKEWGRTEFADWIRSVGGKEKKEEKCYVM